jgi:arylsulfatase A-like enzyme
MDTLRADHVSAYGYERTTTPHLDAWMGEQGVRFAQAISTSPWTCPSVAAMFTGRSPTSLGATFATIRNSVPQEANTLAELLQRAGYATAGFPSIYCTLGKLGFSQGFDFYPDALAASSTPSDKARAAEINALAMDWLSQTYLQQEPRQPLFLFLHYFDPHTWYMPPPPYDLLFDPDYQGAFTSEVFGNAEKVVTGELTPSARDIEHLEALYDGEVMYADAYFGQMMEFLQAHGLLDNALVIVTADHGEFFGEHNRWVHTSSLYQEVLHVPLFLRYTGAAAAGSISIEPVQNFDIFPTVLDWVGIAPPDPIQAVSLKPQMMGQAGDQARPIFSELGANTDPKHALYWIAPHVNWQAVQLDGWKLIHIVEDPTQDALYLLNPLSPFETENQISSEPELYQDMLKLLQNYFVP